MVVFKGSAWVMVVGCVAAGCAGPAASGTGDAVTINGGGGPDASTPRKEPKHPLEGAAAPMINLKAEGGPGRATIALPDQVVIVDFWATHCGPCVKAFPKLQALADEHPGKVSIVAVSEDEESEMIAPFLQRTGVTFAVGWDEDKGLAKRYHVDSMPTTFVLDSRGIVRFVHRGYRDDEPAALRAEVQKLLAE